MRTILLIVGVVLVLVGLLWIGQGTGAFPYPSSSFMIDQTVWAYRGAGCAVVGAILAIISRRRRR